MYEPNPNCCICKGYCSHGGKDDLRHLYCGWHAKKRFAPKPDDKKRDELKEIVEWK